MLVVVVVAEKRKEYIYRMNSTRTTFEKNHFLKEIYGQNHVHSTIFWHRQQWKYLLFLKKIGKRITHVVEKFRNCYQNKKRNENLKKLWKQKTAQAKIYGSRISRVAWILLEDTQNSDASSATFKLNRN